MPGQREVVGDERTGTVTAGVIFFRLSPNFGRRLDGEEQASAGLHVRAFRVQADDAGRLQT